jgi:ethanolamine utilization protein EutQ (cupin superfamily)
MQSIRLIKGEAIQTQARGGATDGVAQIAWAIPDDQGAPLPCGFGRLHEALCEPKTLDYDEVILVLEGVLGVEAGDGTRIEGRAGDVIEIVRGTTIRYSGTHAKLFFVTR